MPISRHLGPVGWAVLVWIMTVSLPTVGRAAQPVIGLMTDFGWDDAYVAQVKGAIITVNPDARVMDLTHSVTPFSVPEGAYLLDQAAQEFPKGTVFVAVVDPGVGTERDPILVETAQGKFFIGPDNGIFTTVIDTEGFTGAWKLDQPQYFRAGTETTSHTFHARDIFGPVAAHLAAGVDPERLGSALTSKSLVMLSTKEPTFSSGTISASVLHIDRYGNVILNLKSTSDVASKLPEGNLVKILIGRESFSGPLVKTYGEVGKGRLILLYNGSGLLEIGMNQGSAAKMLKVEPGTTLFLKP
jgi:S-adenosylmethionine hydrolase